MKSGKSATRNGGNASRKEPARAQEENDSHFSGDVTASEMGHEINREECIRDLAYQKWQEAGCPECDGTQFWLDAEHELSTTNLHEVAS